MDAEATDEDLMAHVAAEDQSALRVLMSRYMRRAIALAERVAGGNVDADDVSQEAFLRVWKNASRFDARRARFSTWFFKIVVNLAIDRSRRSSRQRPLEDAGEVAAEFKDPATGMMAADQDRALAAAMASLPERQRAAIALFHMEGLSGRDAAESLGVSEKAFESLLTRARAGLKARIAELEGGAGS